MLTGVASIVATEAAAFEGRGSVRNRLVDTPNSPIPFSPWIRNSFSPTTGNAERRFLAGSRISWPNQCVCGHGLRCDCLLCQSYGLRPGNETRRRDCPFGHPAVLFQPARRNPGCPGHVSRARGLSKPPAAADRRDGNCTAGPLGLCGCIAVSGSYRRFLTTIIANTRICPFLVYASKAVRR